MQEKNKEKEKAIKLKNGLVILLLFMFSGVLILFLMLERQNFVSLTQLKTSSYVLGEYAQKVQENFTLQVNLGDGKIEKYEIEENQKLKTVWDLMQNIRSQDLNFKSKSFQGLGQMITEINDMPNGQEGKYWFFYINNQKSPVGVSSYRLKAGDVVEWKFE